MENVRLHDFIEFAIRAESEDAHFYGTSAQRAAQPAQRELFTMLCNEELMHEKKLRDYLETGKIQFAALQDVPDLKISDFQVPVEVHENSPLEDIFIYAMKREQTSADLYKRLAALEEDSETEQFFSGLMAEEKQHKYTLESEYEKIFSSEN
jgi:rubrerythrin